MTAPSTAREVIARSTGMCAHSLKTGGAHDHDECLREADALLVLLQQKGFEVIGVTDLPTIERAATEVRRCGHPSCPCRSM